MTQRVVVVGATGQIGRPLCRELVRAGHAATVFSRDPARARQLVPGVADHVAWSPQSLTEECGRQPEPADAVVYLAGSPLFDGHRHSRAEISAAGYKFSFPVLDAAPRDLLGQPDDADGER